MRQVSAAALEAMLASSTDEILLTCLRVSHPTIAQDLLFVNDTVTLTRADGVYQPAAFEFQMPKEAEDEVPAGQVAIDNTDQQIIAAIRPLNNAPSITVMLVLRSSPNVVEVGPLNFKMKSFSYNAQTITGTLSYDEDFLNEQFPKYKFNPRLAPGVF